MHRSSQHKNDFISRYLCYTKDTEVPTFFHRWAAILAISSMLGRNFYFKHGHFRINSNIYCMLIGSPGTRKSTAIKIMKSLLKKAGYYTIAADSTSKAKFILDLSTMKYTGLKNSSGELGEENKEYSILDMNLFGTTLSDEESADCLIAADEFNNFIGLNNLDFISWLGDMWDYDGLYEYKTKTSESISVMNPCLSILGGNTPTNLTLAFPPEIIGQGFFSRLLFVYAETTGRKITFPEPPCEKLTEELVAKLKAIRKDIKGELTMSPEAKILIDSIYRLPNLMEDSRFEYYHARRLSHLIKLCLVICASKMKTVLDKEDVLEANTLLTYTEQFMSKALGQFGKSRHADVAHKILALLNSARNIVTLKDLWKATHTDLERMSDLTEIIRNLASADKIQMLPQGFLSKRAVLEDVVNGMVDFNYLSEEERKVEI